MPDLWKIIPGDVRESLALLPERSVHVAITSPPYWGLRDYGHPAQLGLEQTMQEYIAGQVEVFREVRRVLRDDGTLWLNMGDRYTSTTTTGRNDSDRMYGEDSKDLISSGPSGIVLPSGMRPGNLMGMPWRLAFALQADGWFLRSDIIWAKSNPMPESVKNRPTKSHEYMFLLSKQQQYYYDGEAVKNDSKVSWNAKRGFGVMRPKAECLSDENLDLQRTQFAHKTHHDDCEKTGANLRTVWSINTEALKSQHFAAFPQKLVVPCIKAGTSERGCCPKCGAHWTRIVARGRNATRPGDESKVAEVIARTKLGNTPGKAKTSSKSTLGFALEIGNRDPQRHVTFTSTVGWEPGCACGEDAIPCTVLDPYCGSGTTLLVASKLGRRSIGCELNPEYVEMAKQRITQGLRPDAIDKPALVKQKGGFFK